MRRWIGISLLLFIVVATPARAQVVVIDPGNLVQTILIAERTWEHYQQLRREYETIRSDGDQSRQHGPVTEYPAIAITRHDPSRWEYGRPWIEGLNSGDPSGAAYAATTLPLERPNGETARLTAAARRAFERRYATVEITDTVAMRGGHQVALVRNYHGRLQDARPGARERRPESGFGVPRDDGDPRQDRRRRTAGPSSRHGHESALVARAGADAGAKQTGAGHGGRDDQYAADHVARWRRPRTRPSSREPVTRFEHGASHDSRIRTGGMSPCVAPLC